MIIDFPVGNMEKGCLKQVLKTYFETPPFIMAGVRGCDDYVSTVRKLLHNVCPAVAALFYANADLRVILV